MSDFSLRRTKRLALACVARNVWLWLRRTKRLALACEAGARIKPGVERALRAKPQVSEHDKFSSPRMRATEQRRRRYQPNLQRTDCRPFHGLEFRCFWFLGKPRSTPGFMLTPAPQAKNRLFVQSTFIKRRPVIRRLSQTAIAGCDATRA
jgi:hypothetical protein